MYIASLEITDETMKDAGRIFNQMGQCIQQNAQWFNREDLSDKLIFPSRDHRWMTLSDHPMYIDNHSLAELFSSFAHLPLIFIDSLDSLHHFFDLYSIPRFSSMISIEHHINNSTINDSIRHLLSPLIPSVQLFLQSREEFSSIYQWTKSICLHSILPKIQFYGGDHLRVIYRYRTDPLICVTREENCSYDEDQHIFYIEQSWFNENKFHREIFKNIARVFIPIDQQEQFIPLIANFLSLLYNEDQNNLQTFAKYHQFDLQLKDPNDIPWELPSNIFSIPDQTKVQTLLATVAQKQEFHQQRKRQFAENAMTTSSEN